MALPRNYINNPPVFALGHRPYASVQPFSDVLNRYQFALGGVPFISAASNGDPTIRRTATFRTSQFDASNQPGEQSLTGWWLRSQTSFHLGTGLVYEEPAVDDQSVYRFADAEGVNVWTPGSVSLLPDVTNKLPSPPSPSSDILCVGGTFGDGTDMVAWANGANAGIVTYASSYTITGLGGAAVQSVISDGATLYFATTGGIWSAPIPAAPGNATASQLWTFTCTRVALGWCMGRLMAGVDGALYSLVPSGTPPLSLPATPVYTALVSGWRWTSITAGPSKIYASGYSGNRGSILAVSVDNTGLLPTLSGATEAAQLPTGEWPLICRTYLGSFLAIGTNKGVRVASIDSSGNLSYGPLITTPQPVRDMASSDRFVYAAYTSGFSDGNSGLIRIDLSQVVTDGKNAYAKDLHSPANGIVHGVANIGNSGNVAFAVNGSGLYFASQTQLVATGYLTLARIRYDTLFLKIFRSFSLSADIFGSIAVSSIDQTGTQVPLLTIDSLIDISQDFVISQPTTAQSFLSLRFDFARDSTNLLRGPTIHGYQVKALPAGPRPRQFVVAVQCYDQETDQDGVSGGYEGFGYDRLAAVEQLDSSGSIVLFEDLKNKLAWLVQIDQIEFRQEAPPGTNRQTWGGVLNLVMRTLE